ATSNIQAQPFNGTNMNNWTVQNNFFGRILHPGNSVVLGGGAAPSDCSSIVLRHKVTDGPQPNGSGCLVGRVNAYANIFRSDASALGMNVNYAWNVFTTATTPLLNVTGDHDNKKCTVSMAAPSRTGTSGPDYHLVTGDTCAKGAGDPPNFPSTDIDGHARPSAGR